MSEENSTSPPPQTSKGKFGEFLSLGGINSEALGCDNSGIEMIEIKAEDLVKACELLKNSETDFDSLNLITTMDLKKGYQSVYLLESYSNKSQLRIKVTLSKDNPRIASLTDLWKSANWYEREAYDMMGIIYTGHPNLTRLLNPENWEGYPLRKDYIPPSDSLNGPHPLSETEYASSTLQMEKSPCQ